VTKRVKLTLEELKKAEPLPSFYDDGWECDPQTLMWVIWNADKWKSKRIKSKGRWIEPVKSGKEEYDGAVWVNDKIYLVASEAFAILAEATGEKTVNEIIEKLILDVIQYRGPNCELAKAIERNEQEKLQGLYALYYRHFAMLKERGLLI